MRVYLPSTSTVLQALVDAAAVVPAGEPLAAFAVTPGLRAWYREDGGGVEGGVGGGAPADADAADDEDLEYAATAQAAHASIWLLDADRTASRRRVVVAADVADHAVEVVDSPQPGSVLVREPIALAAVASVHMDDEAAQDTIAAAASEAGRFSEGDQTALDLFDRADEIELGWFATQELPALLATL